MEFCIFVLHFSFRKQSQATKVLSAAAIMQINKKKKKKARIILFDLINVQSSLEILENDKF